MTLRNEAQKMDIAKFIHFLVDDKLVRGEDNTNKILVINLHLSVSDYSGEKEKIKKCFPSILFYRRGSYVTSAVIEREMMSNDIMDKQIAKYLGCHDSCWRGHVEDYLRDVSKGLTDGMNKESGVFNTFSLFGVYQIIEGNLSTNEEKGIVVINKK